MRVIRCKDLEAIYRVCVKRAANYQGNGYVYHADTGEQLVLTVAHKTNEQYYVDTMKRLVNKGMKVSIRL